MDFTSFFVFSKPNQMKMRQPNHTRSYGTISDSHKKMDTCYNNQSLKLTTPACMSLVDSSFKSSININNIVIDKGFKPTDNGKTNMGIGSLLNTTLREDPDNRLLSACHVIAFNTCTPISRSKSMPPDLKKQDGSEWDFITHIQDSSMDADTMDNSKKENLNSCKRTKDIKVSNFTPKEKRQMFKNAHRKMNKSNITGVYYSLDEVNKQQEYLSTGIFRNNLSRLFLEMTQNMTGEQFFLKYPCRCATKDFCQHTAADGGNSKCIGENDNTAINFCHMANDDTDLKNGNGSDRNNMQSIDTNNCLHNSTQTINNSNITNDLLYEKEYHVLTEGNVHTEANSKKETEKIIASVSLLDSNGSQLAGSQIDKIESNITEINAECEGVTVVCLAKITRCEPKYRNGFVDRTLSLNIDKHGENYQPNSDGKSSEAPLSVDVVDYAAVPERASQSRQVSCDKSPAMPYSLRHLENQIDRNSRYALSSSKTNSEVVDKTYQVSEGIDAILKRLGRHDDKSLGDTMKSHDNSLHRLSAGDGAHPKGSRFLLKRAQEKESEAARKAQKEAQEQRDSVSSCEDKMNRLKQLFSSKKTDSFSDNVTCCGPDPLYVDSSATVISNRDTQSSVDSSITDKPNSNNDKPTCNSDENSDKQNSLLSKSDHNFYHTESADDQDCFCESGPNATTIHCSDENNICESVIIATETEIIDEKEIKCQIIPPDPILPETDTANNELNSADHLNIVDNEGRPPPCLEMCSTAVSDVVELDCSPKSEPISSDDSKCVPPINEIMENVKEDIHHDVENESLKSAPTNHLEINVESDPSKCNTIPIAQSNSADSYPIETKTVLVKQPNDMDHEKPAIIDNCEDKMAKLKAMLAEKKTKKTKKYISKEVENVSVDCEKLQKLPAPIVIDKLKDSINNKYEEGNSDTNSKTIVSKEIKQSKDVHGVEIEQIKTAVVKPVEVKINNPANVKSVEIKQIKTPVKNVDIKQIKTPTKTVEIKQIKTPVKIVEVKQMKAPIKTVELKHIKPLLKTVELKQIKPLVKTVELKQIKPLVKTVELKQGKTSIGKNIETKNKFPAVKTFDIKQNKVPLVKPVETKQDKTTDLKTVEVSNISKDQENKNSVTVLDIEKVSIVAEDNNKKEPLTKNDVEISSPSIDVQNDSNKSTCSKAARTKCRKGKSGKLDSKKHKNEHSSKRHRQKERDDHKRDIREHLTFDPDVEPTTGPLYFSTETLELHTQSKKPRHGGKTKSSVRDTLSKCANYLSNLPAKVAICKPNLLEFQDENSLPGENCQEFVMVEKEDLSTADKKCNRVRLPSECESEDSFVICFQGSQEDLRNTLDESDDDDFGDSACSETDSSDEDDDSSTGTYSSDDGYEGLAKKTEDVDSGVIVGIMKKRGIRDSPGKSATNMDKKVSFTASPPKVHKMITWAYAYRQARIGTWERCARDAERFRQRITDTSLCLDWVLKREHRARVYFQRFRPLLMRAIREEKEAKAKRAKEDKERAIKEKEMEEELMKQREIEEKEKAEQIERDGAMIVEDILNTKSLNSLDDMSLTVINDSDLVVVGNLNDTNKIGDEKLLIVNNNEKCDSNNKILNVSNGKKGGLTVHPGKNGTCNVKAVSPTK